MHRSNVQSLPDDLDTLKALVLAEREENDRLRDIIKALQRARFGRSAETLDPDQLHLGLRGEDLAAANDDQDEEDTAPPRRKKKRRGNRGALPPHLPRIEEIIEPESTVCPCCQGTMHTIGEDKSERLDVIPAQFRVIVTRRPKYGCRRCESAILQAPAPARLIEGGLPTERLLAHVAVSRYADHLPLYRQAQLFARQGVMLDRSTLADWMRHTAFELKPLHDRLIGDAKGSARLFMDETRAPVLEPGLGRTKHGYFWSIARDDRPWGGKDPPMAIYLYAPGRGSEHAIRQLKGFSGILQVDGYAAYKCLLDPKRAGGPLMLAYCWSHVRRRYYEIAQGGNAPIANEALLRIQRLYGIEKEIRGQSADQRRETRQAKAKPIVEVLRPWLEHQLERVSAGSTTAKAIRYTLNHWDGLLCYLDDGRIEIDSNTVERSIRPLALSRKNALFGYKDAGGERWAILASLVETCKLNNVDPQAWMTDVLTRLVNGHRMSEIDDLLPWRWAASQKPLAEAA